MIGAGSRTTSARSESTTTDGKWWQALLPRAGGILALAAVVAPLLIAAVSIAIQQPDAVSDGDQAVDEVALIRSTHFAQLVGNYSRYGWSHPGPAWFYAYDPVYVPLGQHSWSVTVAVLVLHAVFAGLIVAVMWRRTGPFVALLTAGLLLLYVRALGEPVFRAYWPPYALMLPMMLLFVLSASGAAGSTPALAAALVVGSFIAQLHVGTVPVVLAVLGTMVAVRLALHLALDRRQAPERAARRSRVAGAALTAGAALALLVMWLPVAVDEITGRPGNLTKLFEFFSAKHDTHPYGMALSALGRLLVFPLRPLPEAFGPDAPGVPLSRALIVVLFVVAAGALVVLGARLRDRFALALGLLLVVAIPVVTLSIARIVGPVYAYLLVWVTAFPVLLAIGWAALVARARPWAAMRLPAPRAAASGLAALLCVGVVALAAGRAAAFQALPPALGDAFDPNTRPAWTLAADALANEPNRSVRVVIADNDRWVLAAGLVLQLQKHGWTVTVNRDYVFMFGDATRPTGTEAVVLVVASTADLPAVERQMPDVREIGHTSGEYLLVGHSPPPGP